MSRGAALIALIVVMAAILGAVILLAPMDENSDDGGKEITPGVEYGISYVLNGGVLGGEAPSS